MRGYVDESVRVGAPGLYVLAGVVVPDNRAGEIREQLRRDLPRGQLRFHWRDESAVRRRSFAKQVATLELDSLVVVCTPMARKRTERARRACLGHLLFQLEQRGVFQVVLESRQPNLNREDDSAIGYARRNHLVSRRLRYEFGRPMEEPLLWLPDSVAGAVAAAVHDGERDFLTTLGPRVHVIDVPKKA